MVVPSQAIFRPTDLHRVFAQSILSRRVVPEDVLLELYKRAVSACHVADENFRPVHQTNKQGLRSFIKDINTMFDQSGLQLEMRTAKDEDGKGDDIWALINTDASDEAPNMTDYEPLQISYFKTVASAILGSYPSNSIGSNIALNLTSELLSPLTKSAAAVLLDSFVARGWFNKSKRGRYALAPRAIMELEPWITAEYGDFINKCARCSKTVFTGVICGNEECDAHIHKSCYSVLLTIQNPKCPKCEKRFTDTPVRPLGERAAPREEDNFNRLIGRKKRSSAAARGGGPVGSDEDELDDDEEDGNGNGEDDDDDETDGRTQPLAGSSSAIAAGGSSKFGTAAAAKRTRKAAVADSDDE